MPRPSDPQRRPAQRSRAKSAAVLVLAAVAGSGVAVAGVSGLAAAKSAHPSVGTASNARLHETVLVDPHGSTLYQLSPETTRQLLCKTSACLSFWPPLKASSAKAKPVKGAGIKGKLGTMHRSGFLQITLDGRPLYRFSGDSAKGQANGEGIHSFGGVWHVVKARGAGGGGTQTTTTPTTSTTTSASSTYSYPGY